MEISFDSVIYSHITGHKYLKLLRDMKTFNSKLSFQQCIDLFKSELDKHKSVNPLLFHENYFKFLKAVSCKLKLIYLTLTDNQVNYLNNVKIHDLKYDPKEDCFILKCLLLESNFSKNIPELDYDLLNRDKKIQKKKKSFIKKMIKFNLK